MSTSNRAAPVLLGLLHAAFALAACSSIDPNPEDGSATGEAAFIGATPPSPHASASIIDPNPGSGHATGEAAAIDGTPPHPHKGAIDPVPPNPHASASILDPNPETNH